jgi:hypothetical protein
LGTAFIMPDKGKVERGVGYVKSNALAGRAFASWAASEAHLEQWTREIARLASILSGLHRLRFRGLRHNLPRRALRAICQTADPETCAGVRRNH